MRRLVFFVVAMLAAGPALAYLGPGAGLGMLGSLFAVIGAVLLALFGLIVLPVRMIMKKRRRQATPPTAES
jgi:Na+/proline symporter